MRKTQNTFEQGTGYAPELLAERAAVELRHLLRHRRYDRAMPALIQQVTERAERCWTHQPRWRIRWAAAGKAGHTAALLRFFRHWTAAATHRKGIALPGQVLETYALGHLPRGAASPTPLPPPTPASPRPVNTSRSPTKKLVLSPHSSQ